VDGIHGCRLPLPDRDLQNRAGTFQRHLVRAPVRSEDIWRRVLLEVARERAPEESGQHAVRVGQGHARQPKCAVRFEDPERALVFASPGGGHEVVFAPGREVQGRGGPEERRAAAA